MGSTSKGQFSIVLVSGELDVSGLLVEQERTIYQSSQNKDARSIAIATFDKRVAHSKIQTLATSNRKG